MDIILNYLFIGFALTFLIDGLCFYYKEHKAFKNVPEWDWVARTFFAVFWPLGIGLFVYVYIKENFK